MTDSVPNPNTVAKQKYVVHSWEFFDENCSKPKEFLNFIFDIQGERDLILKHARQAEALLEYIYANSVLLEPEFKNKIKELFNNADMKNYTDKLNPYHVQSEEEDYCSDEDDEECKSECED